MMESPPGEVGFTDKSAFYNLVSQGNQQFSDTNIALSSTQPYPIQVTYHVTAVRQGKQVSLGAKLQEAPMVD